jgi:hypothetical protein
VLASIPCILQTPDLLRLFLLSAFLKVHVSYPHWIVLSLSQVRQKNTIRRFHATNTSGQVENIENDAQLSADSGQECDISVLDFHK